jgi:Cys-tRNA(Pro)/Cys-tRNA(Cys) deacylase
VGSCVASPPVTRAGEAGTVGWHRSGDVGMEDGADRAARSIPDIATIGPMSTKGTRAIELLRQAAIMHTVHEYSPALRHGRERDARPDYGREAAAALGVEPARVFKTLVAVVDDRLVLAIVPVDRELDMKALARAEGGRRAALADPSVAERATGRVIGGISPFGGRRTLPAVLDRSAFRHQTIHVSAGRRGLQVELGPGDLVSLANARVETIARPG